MYDYATHMKNPRPSQRSDRWRTGNGSHTRVDSRNYPLRACVLWGSAAALASAFPAARGEMYGQAPLDGDEDRTAFRKAEKKYKLYKVVAKKSRKVYVQPDLSEVVDFNYVLECWNQGRKLPLGIFRLERDLHGPVFCFEGRPEFYFIPGALSIQEQCHWVKESLTEFPQPPNRTNHNAIYGAISDLFIAAENKKVLVEESSLVADAEPGQSSPTGYLNGPRWALKDSFDVPKGYKSIAASVLLRKLRWSTLGLQFNWSKRNYDVSLPHEKISDKLCQLAKKLAMPAMPVGTDFCPEAAIVNYFGEGDMLGGHIDDMEADWSKPIVSISLGCKAIFLLGGKTRDDPPVAMFLRSGDVVLMAGQARECFHGVPRIFADEKNSDVSDLTLQLSHPGDRYYVEYIRTSRINVNIRQVY